MAPARPSTMPPLAAADAFLVLEVLIGNRRVPHAVFAALLAALPSVSPHASPRMRKGVALRALDLALSDSDADADASVLLRDARTVLADPDLGSCFPNHLALCDDVAALKRLVDAEWASLPPSALEVYADRIIGSGAPQTWANASQDTHRKLRHLGERSLPFLFGFPYKFLMPEFAWIMLNKEAISDSGPGLDLALKLLENYISVGESMEREILAELGEDPSRDLQVDKAANAPSTSGANEAVRAQKDDEAHLGRGNGKADHVQEDCARRQQEPTYRTTDARLPEKPVTSAAIKVGESMEREILGKLGQDPSTNPQVDKAANAPSTSGANEADRAQKDDQAHLGRGNGKASHVEEDCAQHQQEPIERTTDTRLPEKPVTSAAIKGKDKASSSRVTGEISPGCGKSCPLMRGSKPSLMEKNPTASVYEWGDSDDSEAAKPPHKRQLPTYEKPRPPPKFAHKQRKKWSETQEKTLIEGVEKYGKGNWKNIKIAYPDVFIDRSTVDMKDKFRNMERYHIS